MSEGTLEEPHFVRFIGVLGPWPRQMSAALKHGGYGATAARRRFLTQSGREAEKQSRSPFPIFDAKNAKGFDAKSAKELGVSLR